MNLSCAGASKAQERVQNLAHGHPRGVGCFLTVVVLSLVHLRETGTPSHQLTVVEQPIRLKDPKSEREQNFETHYLC